MNLDTTGFVAAVAIVIAVLYKLISMVQIDLAFMKVEKIKFYFFKLKIKNSMKNH